MARISVGNDLAEPKLAPGWKLSDDGFGLRTLTATYNADEGAGFDFIYGEAFPVNGYEYLKLHKQTSSFNALGMQVQTCDYVGIDPDMNGGNYTRPNTSTANGLTAENITAHPNFFVAAPDYAGGALAGLPGDFGGAYDDSVLGPVVNRMSSLTNKVVAVPSCQGYYGACFEQPEGGRFIGFVDPQYPTVYGKTQYLASTTTFSGVIYVIDATLVMGLFECLGKATSTQSFSVFELIPDWCVVGQSSDGSNLNLLSQVNVEEFGTIYKVMYEIRYSKIGWDPGVYINLDGA
jgi:hypothetical protein